MTYSCHSDEGVTGNSGIHDNPTSKLHKFTTFFFLGIVMKPEETPDSPRFSGEEDDSVLQGLLL